MKYRREIDGLRSVAVLPVLLYHSGINFMPGGYVGVDIFFVISGFLITNILIRELETDRFSILGFYERRARRILPALFLVVLCTIPFAWIWMSPLEFKNYSQSLVAVNLFVSNIFFWLEQDYFAAASEQLPLLHTWSLAVEEQYYLFFPVLMFFVWRYWRAGLFWVCLAIAGASLVWCSRLVAIDPSAAFYLLPSRMWELFAGSLLAILRLYYPDRAHNGLSLAGLILIGYSLFAFNEHTSHPSLYTLIPVVGSMLVIGFARNGTIAYTILAHKIPVGIGLISYSAYLWHQPLYAFARIRFLGDPDPFLMLFLASASLFLAWLTWLYVEAPFRRKSPKVFPAQNTVFAVSLFGMALFLTAGVAGHVTNGLPSRLPPEVASVFSLRQGDSSPCHNGLTWQEIDAGETCVVGADGVSPETVVIGDSHAARITDALADTLRGRGSAAALYNGSFCPPLLDFWTNDPARNLNCRRETNAAFTRILENPEIKMVVLFAEWSNYSTGGRQNVTPVAYSYGPEENTDVEQNPALFARALNDTVRALSDAGKRILLVTSTPEYDYFIPNAAARYLLAGQSPSDITIPLTRYKERNRLAERVIKELGPEVTIINAEQIFCGPQNCSPATEDGVVLYFDDNHLNYAGARLIVDAILQTSPDAL